jgi:hypothetical protein
MARVTRLLLASVVLALPVALFAADPPAGTYKIVLPGNRTIGLLKLENADGKWSGTVTRPPKGSPATVEGVKLSKEALQFTLSEKDEGAFLFEGRVPNDKDAKIFGTFSSARGEVVPTILEPTTLSSLDPFDVSRELLTKSTDGFEVTQAALICLSKAAEKKAKTEDAKAWAEKAIKAAEPFGPKWKRTVVMQLAEILVEQDGFTGLALDYAEQASKGLDRASDSPSVQRHVFSLYADALDKAGRTEDAKKVREDMAKIALVNTKEFTRPKGKSDRVVLVELFTCAEEPYCTAPDLAFAALLKTYKPADVVLLQYHLNQPGPDPLANAETEARARSYEASRKTPSIFFNGGKSETPGAGGPAESQATYDMYTEVLARLLEKPAKVKIMATAKRTGSTIDIKTDVTDLPETGPDIRLRVVLVEEEVAYTGGNRGSKCVQVVRHFAKGAAGTAMKTKNVKESFTVDLDTVRKDLRAYLEKMNDTKPYPTKDRPLELKKLRVVAFVQNDETGEVLNAVQVDVKGE